MLLRWLIAAVTDHGEAGADFVGFGGADGGVAGEGFLPVVPGLKRVAIGLAGAGEAVVRACLLQWQAGLGCEPESGGVVRACLTGVTSPEENLTKAVERFGFHSLVADLAEDGKCLLQIPGSLVVAAEPHVNLAEADQAPGFAAWMTHFLEHGQRVLEVSGRVLVAA